MAAYAAPQVNDQSIISQQPYVSNGVLQMHGSDNGEMVCEGHGLNREQCQAIGCCEYERDEMFSVPPNYSCYSSVGQDQCFGTNSNTNVHIGNTHIHTYTYNTQTNEQTRIRNQHIGNTNVKVNLNLKNLKFNFGGN